MANQLENSGAERIRLIERADRAIAVHWADGHQSLFHNIWLRDNCHCAACGDAATGYRYLRVSDIPANLSVGSAGVVGEGCLEVTWEPGHHQSQYQAGWLRRHCYQADERKRRKHQPKLWDASLDRPPSIGYGEVRASDEGLLRLLEQVRDRGLALLQGVPPVVGELEKVASLLGYIVETNFGRVFDVVRTTERKSIANSDLPLVLHTDEPYRYRAPGVMLFHCIVAGPEDGGVSMYADGFNLAETLRREDPVAFDLLTRHAVPYRRCYAGEVDVQSVARIINVDDEGQVIGIRFNDRVMAPMSLPADMVEPLYAALVKLMRIAEREEMRLCIGLRPGDLMIIDNDRILHGRTGFVDGAGARHFRQAHVDRTDFHSRLRILGRRLGRADAQYLLAPGARA